MKRTHPPTLIGIAGLMILLVFHAERIHLAIPTIKVPGPYPYETLVQIPAPTTSESSVLPTPAPFPYPESSSAVSSAPGHASQMPSARRLLTAKAVREAALNTTECRTFVNFWQHSLPM